MVEVWNITIPELTGNETRRAYIYLPKSYKKEPDRRYPVLYMFDGHNVFFDDHATYGKSWGMGDYLDYTNTPLIVAAVECNHSPDNGRLSEYSPYSFKDHKFGAVRGRGRSTMKWMIRTFKRQVDRRYRTLSDREHTFIAGSSMGGLMSLFALIQYNRYFSRAAALSPSLWVAPDRLEHLIAQAPLAPDTVLYMDYGALEFSNHLKMEQQFSRISTALLKRHVLLNLRIVPGGTHCEASWEKQAPFFVEALMYEN
mgnify:CR=1 FL=1